MEQCTIYGLLSLLCLNDMRVIDGWFLDVVGVLALDIHHWQAIKTGCSAIPITGY